MRQPVFWVLFVCLLEKQLKNLGTVLMNFSGNVDEPRKS